MVEKLNPTDFIEIGFVQRQHGLRGEVALVFEERYADSLEELETLFIEIEGGLVPFQIEEEGFRFKNDQSAICQFKLVRNQDQAKELIGCKLFLHHDDLIESEIQQGPSELIGFTVTDLSQGLLGTISRVDDYSGNLVITINHHQRGNEIMIPLSDDFILEFDPENKALKIDAPEGLINIYLE